MQLRAAVLVMPLLACARSDGRPGEDITDPGMGGAGGAGGGSDGAPDFLPTRIRRLSNVEFDLSAAELLGTAETPGRDFAPDVRQGGFTVNEAQTVDAVLARQIQSAARALATKSLDRVLAGQACAKAGADEACAQSFLGEFLPRAFRRPVTDEEVGDLLAVYQSGVQGATFRDGIELVVSAVVQSASFLYASELGPGGVAKPGATVTMTDDEIGAALSYVLTGGPPDAELREAAANKALRQPAQRRAQAERLWATPAAREQVRRLVREWLSLDRLPATGKDDATYPMFAALRASMVRESDDFITEVVFSDDARLETLIGAPYTVVDAPLGKLYGLTAAPSGQRTMVDPVARRGIFNQAAFLSVFGKDTESAPVLRGVAVLDKFLCQHLPTPAELNLDVVPPDPDLARTTRERFEIHSAQPACSSCHGLIDPIGFSFEGFDGMGGPRTMENGKPVSSETLLEGLGADIDGPIAHSGDLAERLAGNATVAECFARNLFRFASAQGEAGPEEKFAAFFAGLSGPTRGDIRALMLAYVASDLFVTRRVR